MATAAPGQIFKLPEEDIRTRVETLEQQKKEFFTYMESATLQQVQKTGDGDSIELLRDVYSGALDDG